MQSQNSLLKDDLLSWPIIGDLSVFNVLGCVFMESILQLCTAKVVKCEKGVKTV